MSCTFYQGDCLLNFQRLAEKSVDLIYFDPPFGTTQCNWDDKLPWKKLFKEFYRVLKDDGTIVIHCSVPFNYTLIREAPKPPNYTWYWKKEKSTLPFIAKKQPMRDTEEILVWYNKKCRFYPQRHGTDKRIQKSSGKSNGYYGPLTEQPAKEVTGRYYTHHLEFKRVFNEYSTRPDQLVELMFNCYAKKGDTVVDPTCHMGMSGVIAKRLGLRWIGFDKYFLPKKLIE